ncbi:Protein N-acetyltransferase, RimJ/RimL family [Flexibacter flexilis DSM 6793]|uniref:Protein N-acetyltransferase, RimJ/RimL family n=1 Tax=Flexibacter flexilis DSM 6793 TaxID=927664 RepID=A0A1I1HUE2_9BACT|nr:GNAT family N-acetyltransferase [Flexibacter flexilis]SFC24600.1 Protein N-acetyltransferase, RimJ/RimL family [Flexibacter flexilis DSM 6793]
MKILTETTRLYLREINNTDTADLFEMDSDPAVHLYIENQPLISIEEIEPVIRSLQKQYQDNGIARWAVVEKATNECVGWAGLKLFREQMNNRQNFYELGYRFKQKHWGKGFATESSKAILDYGFEHLPTETIFAITHPHNANSQKVLGKLGFAYQETFEYEGEPTFWFELTKSHWKEHRNNLSY